MSNPDNPQAWLATANADLLCIRNNLGASEAPWDVVAYHAQQRAEKMLKALLVRHGAVAPRSHDLGRLLGECLVLGLDMHPLAADCDLLTPYGVTSRYPGIGAEVSEAEARAAVDAAERIAGFVAARLI